MDRKFNRMVMTAHYVYFQFFDINDPYFVRFFKREKVWEIKVFDGKERMLHSHRMVAREPTLEAARKALNDVI